MQPDQPHNLNLAPFRRRIRLLRAWRCGAMGGTIGAAVAIVMAVLDYFSIRYFASWALAVPIGLGVLIGVGKAFFERLPDHLVARSVDRRAELEDRLTTATEVPAGSSAFMDALCRDAVQHAASLRARDLYRLRLSRWHGALVSLAAISALVFLMGNTSFLKSAQAKKEAAELKRAAAEVERVSIPVLEEAKRTEATEADKELARRLKRFASELHKARMSKQEALVKVNQLAEEAQKWQQSRTEAMVRSLESAQTAFAKLEKMAERARMEKSDALKLAEQATALENEIAAMEQKLAAQKAGKRKLSGSEKVELEKKLAERKKRLQEIRLSQRAQEFLQKLQAMPEFQEAQEILAKLAQIASARQAGETVELPPEQLEAMAKRLDELARQLDTDEKRKELAQKLLEAAKRARLCKGGNCAEGLLGAFGLCMGGGVGQSPGGLSLRLSKGPGGPSNDRWAGAHGELIMDDKSALLHVKFEDRVLRSQIGEKGPQSYTEVIGPSSVGDRSAIPYQKVLPRYEKSAETVLKRSDIPPRLRGKVRDYFDSLRK
ncbi:MAG TPA: hypothetical protein VNJ09_03105 [Chthonomonadales bacterium]|nr:hypothetical protein [Chthonomonadales bacterium]